VRCRRPGRVVALELAGLLDGLLGAQQGHAAAGHHALFDGCTRGVQRVFDAGLLLLELDLGGRTDLDHCHAAGQLGHAFLQLLAVVVAGGIVICTRICLTRASMSEAVPAPSMTMVFSLPISAR
jgi:hypothetical protein